MATKEAIAQDLVNIASRFNGVVYGGYVRDCIVRKDPFNDLDLWFQTQEDSRNFLEQAGQKYQTAESPDPHSGSYLSTQDFQLSSSIYTSSDSGATLKVDIVAGNSGFPVEDFDINLLQWDGKNLSLHHSHSLYSVDTITKNILSKTAFELTSFKGAENEVDRIKQFQQRGWIIKTEPMEPKIETKTEEDNFAEYFHDSEQLKKLTHVIEEAKQGISELKQNLKKRGRGGVPDSEWKVYESYKRRCLEAKKDGLNHYFIHFEIPILDSNTDGNFGFTSNAKSAELLFATAEEREVLDRLHATYTIV